MSAAKQQLATTLNAQRNGADVRYENAVGIEMPVEWHNIKRKIGIVTLKISDAVYSDPLARYQLGHFVEDFRGIEVHYFLLSDLKQASLLLTTFKDFVSYLDTRKAAANQLDGFMSNELDLLILFKTRYDDLEEILDGDDINKMLIVEPGSWENSVSAATLREKIESNMRESSPIDSIISMVFTTIEISVESGSCSRDQAILQYRIVVGLLSQLCRVSRRQIGRKLVEKRQNTLHKEDSYFVQIQKDLDLAILFLVTNTPKGSGRMDRLGNFGAIAAKKVNQTHPVKNLLCIATEGRKQKGFSIDYLFGQTVDFADLVNGETEIKMFKDPELKQVDEWEQL